MDKTVVMLETINWLNQSPEVIIKFIKENNLGEERFISKITEDGVNYLIEK